MKTIQMFLFFCGLLVVNTAKAAQCVNPCATSLSMCATGNEDGCAGNASTRAVIHMVLKTLGSDGCACEVVTLVECPVDSATPVSRTIEQRFSVCGAQYTTNAQRVVMAQARSDADLAHLSGENISRAECLLSQCQWGSGECDCSASSIVSQAVAARASAPAAVAAAAPPIPATSPPPAPDSSLVGSGLARPTEPSFGRVPDHAEHRGGVPALSAGRQDPALQRAGPSSPSPTPAPPLPARTASRSEADGPPPPQGEEASGVDLCSRVHECVGHEVSVLDDLTEEVYSLAEEALRLVHLGVNLGGFWFATERVSTNGVSVGATLMLGLGVSDLEFNLRGGYVAWSNSAFVGVEFAYVPEVGNDFRLDLRGGTMWAPLGFHTGDDQTRTPHAEIFGGTIYLGLRHQWFGAGLRGFVGAGESEGPNRGFAHGGELVLSVILGR